MSDGLTLLASIAVESPPGETVLLQRGKTADDLPEAFGI